jgi:glycosyltransferase involved in cell wall biosynthesis
VNIGIKVLVICAALDISKPYGSTPALWQLFKAMYELGHELIIIPYHGHAISSLWWRCYPNPNYYKGMILEKVLKMVKHSHGKKNIPFIPTFARFLARPNIERLVNRILLNERDVEAVLMINVPLNQLKGFATHLRRNHANIPIIVYDIDVPTSLPSHGGFTFNHYVGADLSEYDSFIIPSEGSVHELRELGATDVHIVHFGVDPDVYTPMPVKQDIDVLFFGNGSRDRENNIRMMITEPSKVLKYKFVISGRYLHSDVGNAITTTPFSFTEWRKQCSGSKINLNVVRETHAKVFGTSTSRPFELASMKCCTVSAPYRGLENWFVVGKEILIARSSKECIELYRTLIDDDDLRIKIGEAARARVKKEHTSRHRAEQIIDIIRKI